MVVGLFLLPFVTSTGSLGWDGPKAIVLLLAMTLAWIFFLIAALRRRQAWWRGSPLDWLAVGWLVLVAVGTAMSVDPWQSLTGLNGLSGDTLPVAAGLVSLYLLVGHLFTRPREQLMLWLALLGGVGATLLVGFFQLSGFSILPSFFPRHALYHLLSGSTSDVAVLAAIIGPAALIGWRWARQRWQRLAIAAAVTLSWLIVFIYNLPVGWTVFAVGMITVVLTQAVDGPKANARVIGAAVGLTVVGLLVYVFGLANASRLPSRAEVRLDTRTAAAISWQSLVRRPVLGSGPQTWYQDFVRYRPVSYNRTPLWNRRFVAANAGWWQIIATGGLAMTLFWLGLFVTAGGAAWMNGGKKSPYPLFLALMTLIIGVVAGFFGTWSLTLLAMIWLALGTVRALRIEGRAKLPPLGAWSAVSAALVILAVIGVWVPVGRATASVILTDRVQGMITARAALSDIRRTLNRAAALDGHNLTAGGLLANSFAAEGFNDLQRGATTNAMTLFRRAAGTMTQTVERNSRDPFAYELMNNFLNDLATVLADVDTQARQNFLRLRRLEPSSPIHDVGYGQVLMVERARLLSGENPSEAETSRAAALAQQALTAFDQALEKKPDYLQAAMSKVQVHVLSGQLDTATAESLTLTRTYPNVAGVWQQYGVINAKLNRQAEAVEAFERSLTLDPRDPTTYLAFAQSYLDQQKTDEAKKVLDRGLAVLPTDSRLQSKRGELQ